MNERTSEDHCMTDPAHVPASDLAQRMARLRGNLAACEPEWRTALVLGKVNLYYLTGTMQNGVLVIPRDDDTVFYVRRSYERALRESTFERIEPISGFRDLEGVVPSSAVPVHVETEVLTLAMRERLGRYMPVQDVRPLDLAMSLTRAVKSEYELACMRRSGEIHRYALEEFVPSVLREGMTEAELATALLAEMLDRGHHGVARIGMFDTDFFFGQVSFGENAVYPSAFDGPDGVLGLCPAVPYFASRQRRLRRGDLVFVDVACGVDGYHTDKTMVYAFGDVSKQARHLHERCVEIHDRIAERLRPGEVPSAIYEDALAALGNVDGVAFMGTPHDQVRFVGHGIGLTIDEHPVLARTFDQPLETNMTLAVEPKLGIPGVGMVGVENTFVVTPGGGVSLTGSSPGMVEI